MLVRNPKWWGNPGGPESITLITNSNGQAQVQALQNQEVQVIQPQPDAALAQQLRSTANVEFNAVPGPDLRAHRLQHGPAAVPGRRRQGSPAGDVLLHRPDGHHRQAGEGSEPGHQAAG